MSTQQAASQIDELIEHQSDNSISVIMPTHKAGRQVKQNAIRFKNLVTQAVEQLVDQGEAESEAEKRVKPLRDLQRDDNFWQHQQDGLAVYLSGEELVTVGLHESPAECVMVSDKFYVAPVALDAAGRKRCRVLALTWEQARIYLANRSEMKPEESDIFPVALRDVVLPPDAEEHLQFRTQSTQAGGTMFHGQGEGENTIESDRKRFLSEVGKRLESISGQSALPLIIVGTEEVRGEFMAATKILATDIIDASPDGLDQQDLVKRVLTVVNEEHNSAEQLSDKLAVATTKSQGSRDLPEIVEAAAMGRVQRLLINSNALQRSDSCDDQTRSLINIAVIRTMQTGGVIMDCSASVLEDDPIAAIYRY